MNKPPTKQPTKSSSSGEVLSIISLNRKVRHHLQKRPHLPSGLLCSDFPNHNPVCTCSFTLRLTSPLLDLVTHIVFGEQYGLRSFSLFSPCPSPISLSLLGQHVFLSNVFSNAIGLICSLRVRDQSFTSKFKLAW
jgi:hypothetical protein